MPPAVLAQAAPAPGTAPARTPDSDRDPRPDPGADAFAIKGLFAAALRDQQGVEWLRQLSEDVGARPAGSPGYAAAVDWAEGILRGLGLRTRRQPVRVRPWSRGEDDVVDLTAYLPAGRRALRATALGNSPGTGERGLRAPVVELTSIEQADSLGDALAGKIAFYNRAFDPAQVNTFAGYGGAVDQRVYGPARAARQGAVAAVVRSMTPRLDRLPHTGTTVFPDDAQTDGDDGSGDGGDSAIPAVAISTLDAEALAAAVREAPADRPVELFLRFDAGRLPPATDHNLIADWTGTERPGEYLLIGAHLDSWDLGQGAHDDGAGVAHVLEAVNLLRASGYRPRRTVRVVLFANEENGLDGGRAYWALTDSLGLEHAFAIESDSGGFVPRAFTVAPAPGREGEAAEIARAFAPLLEPYGVTFAQGGGGADIRGLRERGATLFGLRTDGQRYFDLHHTARDTFSEVHPRELELGAAALASLVRLLDAQP